MFSPTWLKTLEDIPQRTETLPIYDEAVAAEPATGDPASPVGLGAFVFESYTPGNGNSFKLTRNEDYWRGPNGITGENLPYLDSVEGVVAVDIDSRSNGVRSAQFDIIHTSNADSINQFLDEDELEIIATSLYGDTGYIMLNVAEGETDPDGRQRRQPAAQRALPPGAGLRPSTVDRYIEERDAGLSLKANGPFGPGVLGYLEDTGYPQYDPDAALEEFETCKTELGVDTIEFTFNTTNDPFNVESNTLIISMWQEVFGDEIQATITPIEQGQYIGLALTGTFNAFGWRNHGGIDPATQAYWWASTSSAPIGELALNFGRFKDPDMDALFETIKGDPDPAARQAAAEDVNRIFGEQVYNLWLGWALWAHRLAAVRQRRRDQHAHRRRRGRRPGLLRPSPDEPALVRRGHVRLTDLAQRDLTAPTTETATAPTVPWPSRVSGRQRCSASTRREAASGARRKNSSGSTSSSSSSSSSPSDPATTSMRA